MSRLCCVALFLLNMFFGPLLSSLSAQVDPTNGIQELLLQRLDDSGDIEWAAYNVENKTWNDLGFFGKDGDSPIAGAWTSEQADELAFLRNKVLYVRDAEGTTHEIKIPELGPRTLLRIADLDNNGISDVIAVTTTSSSVFWRIRLNPLVAPENRKLKSFGSKNNIPLILTSRDRRNLAFLSTFRDGRSARISLCTIPCKKKKSYALSELPTDIEAEDAITLDSEDGNDRILVRYSDQSFLVDLKNRSTTPLTIDSETLIRSFRLTRSSAKFQALQRLDGGTITIFPSDFSNEYTKFDSQGYMLVGDHKPLKAAFGARKPSTPVVTPATNIEETPTIDETSTATPVVVPTEQNTPNPTMTPTPTEYQINTGTPTFTATNTSINTNTPLPTQTRTSTPSHTPTRTFTASSTPSNTPTRTYTRTPVPTNTTIPTNSPTSTSTRTSTSTNTPNQTSTPTTGTTNTATPSISATATSTSTPTSTATPSNTPTATNTRTPSNTPTVTSTATQTPTPVASTVSISKMELLDGNSSQVLGTIENNVDFLLPSSIQTVKLRFTTVGAVSSIQVSLNNSALFTLTNGQTVTPAFALGAGPVKIAAAPVTSLGVVQAPTIVTTNIIITSSSFYGSGLAAHSLSNATIGTSSNAVNSIRFRADASGVLRNVQLYWIFKTKPGYHSGDGGIIRITLRPDDGTAAHNPTSEVLSTLVFTPNLPLVNLESRLNIRMLPMTFPNPASVTRGKLYHIHLENIAPDPVNNWISINSMYNWTRQAAIAQPVQDTTDLSIIRRTGTGAWAPIKGYVPIYGVYIDTNNDGTVDFEQGQSYMEFWASSSSGLKVNGTSRVRQSFSPTTRILLKQLHISMGKYAGNDPVTVQIKTSNGTVLASGSINSGSLPLVTQTSSCPQGINDYCHQWTFTPLSPQPTLQAGQTYYIEFSTTTGSEYQLHMIRDGSIQFDFPMTGSLSTGNAQFSANNGSTWSGVTFWSTSNRLDGDLSFYFDSEKL